MTIPDALLREGLMRWRAAPWRLYPTRSLPPLTLVGTGQSLDYVARQLGRDPAQATAARPVPAWRLGPALQRHLEQDGIVLARLPCPLATRLCPMGLLMPELVDSVIDVAEERWLRSRSARSNLQRIADHRLTWRLSTGSAAVERFYTHCYLPYLQARHGSGAALRSRRSLARDAAHGGIQEVCLDGETVAAQLVGFGPDELQCIAVGVPGDGELARESGAIAATTAFAIELARQRGLAFVNLGGSLPLRRNPVLLSKSYWGARVTLRPRADHDLLLAWRVWSPSVARILTTLVPILRSPHGLVSVEVPGLRPLHGLSASLQIPPGASSRDLAQMLMRDQRGLSD
ncbi:MAG TPA: hypothetical protein VHL31_18125 [Geminicoccus sp.]|uniref:hypothetical protein n=1 Tax=Geminicoccus sp. TaxID=2024832 RepID=UPI002E31D69F|nr:hypothetical protein [Geminicoccus sp.]HEX2528206.1 hypothetical protein [Geminicoccus sp.]